MRVYLEDAEELAERQIKALRRALTKAGTATLDGVRRSHVLGTELRYDLLVMVVPGWVTATSTTPGRKRAPHGANIAATDRILNRWVKDTALKVGSKAEVTRCDVSRPDHRRQRELHLCLVVCVPNAAHDGLTRTTRAGQQGAGHPGLPGHVRSGPGGAA